MLEPAAGTTTYDRDAMRVHGDNTSRPARPRMAV